MATPTQQYSPSPSAQQPASIATASVVLGAIGFVVGICSVVGLVLGLVARGQARRGQISPARVTTGIVVSSISLAVGILGWIGLIALIGGGASNDLAAPSTRVEATSPATEEAVQEAAADEALDLEVDEPVPSAAEVAPAPVPTAAAAETSAAVAGETVSQKNAVRSAETYLDYSSFSRSGLIGQLEFEGFSTEDATYAVDTITVDWNEQAAKSAENYLDYSSFSRQGLVDQLEFEGFTPAEAEFGVSQTGL
jgi:hypothetical protein